MRVLLIGGSGQLGTEIGRRWSGYDISAPPHAELDLEDVAALESAIDRLRPKVVVNCAAFHNVDRCTAEPERAFAANAVAVGKAAAICHRRDVLFVTISTDYVFDGQAREPYLESDAPNPISAYGVSKLAGEYLVALQLSPALVVRTCGVYGVRASSTKGYTFIDRIIAQATAGEPVRIVNDVIASPTYAGHLAEALQQLVAAGATGLYHAANVGAVSWYDFAAEALRQAGIAHPIEPISASEWKSETRRPAFSALGSERLGALHIAMPSWREGIAAYLSDKRTCDRGG
ncbi:MAG: dTDP-4-dehydrorhamnose reductase [Vulcanimicrobiaceae bacterium]